MADNFSPISKELIDTMKAFAEATLKAIEATEKLLTSGVNLVEANNKLSTSEENSTKKKQKLTAVEQESERIRKQQLQTHAKLDVARSKAVVALTKSQIELKKVNAEVLESITGERASKEAIKKTNEERKKAEKVLKEQQSAVASLERQRQKSLEKQLKGQQSAVLATEALKGSYNAISKSLSANIIKWKNLTTAERENTTAGKKLTATIKAQRAELTKLDAKTGQASRGVGKYKEGVLSAGKALIGAFGVTLGLAAFVKVIGSAVKISLQFEAAMSKVKAISGATNQEAKALRENFKVLGETTQKTAEEAAQLGIELSKLGFTPKQILASSEAILKLSIATGEDLAQSAKVAAGTIKAFNLQAKDSGRVTDIMAKSFSSSALDLSKFETAMANAGTVLAENDVSLERSTAQLSVLVDRNIDASTAGSALRNIYLDLNKSGLTLNQALNKIATSTNKSKEAFDLFGKRGATVALVLANNQDRVDELTKSYENSSGAALRMANIMQDNLKGDTDKATSALSGLAINLGERLTPALRKGVQGFTDMVSSVSELVRIKPQEILRKETDQVNQLVIELSSANTSLERRNEIYELLKEISPEIIKGIDTENISISQLRENVNKFNLVQIKRLALADLEAEKQEVLQNASDAAIERYEAEDEVTKRLLQIRKRAAAENEDVAKQIDGVIFSEGDLVDKTEEVINIYDELISREISPFNANALRAEAEFAANAANAANRLKDARIGEAEATEAVNVASDKLIERTSRLNQETPISTEEIEAFVDELIRADDVASDFEFKPIDIIKLTSEEIAAFKKSKKDETKIAKDEIEAQKVIRQGLSDFEIEEENNTNDELEKLREENIKSIDESTKIIVDSEKKAADERLKIEEDLQKRKRDAIIDLTAQGLQGISDILNESASIKRDEELERLSEQRDEDLERLNTEQQEDLQAVQDKLDLGLINEDQAAARRNEINDKAAKNKEKIDDEADRKAAALKTKQAKADKSAALISVAIDTAVAVAKIWAQTGVFGTIAQLTAIAAGAIQAGIILATPIPKFAKGTDSTPSGSWIAGDAGSEAIISPSGQMFLTPDKPTLYSNKPNHQVIPHAETQRMLAELGMQRGFEFSDNGIRYDLQKLIKVSKKTNSSKRIDDVTYTTRGRRKQREHQSFLDSMKS